MGHYDGQEFEKMLQEAEANMLRGIPNLEMPSEPESCPAAPAVLSVSLEEVIEKNESATASVEHGNRHYDANEIMHVYPKHKNFCYAHTEI